MQHIEEAIVALQNLTPDQRAILRASVGHLIEGRTESFSEIPPGWINPHDYAAIRRLAIEGAYKRRVAGQSWVAGKDKAFADTKGGTRPSTILVRNFF